MIGNDIDLKGTLAFKGERGYSAFEIAKQHGWTGTEEDWLANLGTSSHFEECSDIYTATAGQTIFALPSCYTSNSYVDVYVNGSRKNSDEFMINVTSETIVLAAGLNSGDKVEVITLTMSTNELPIIQNITSSSTDTTVPSAECVYKNLNIYYDNIICEKFRDSVSNTDYYITTIPSNYKLKLGTANDMTAGFNSLESTINFAHRKKATLCINAGIYDVETSVPRGILIKDGVILKNDTYNSQTHKTLGIKADGSFAYFDASTVNAETILSQGVETALLGFFPIVSNGSVLPISNTGIEPRQILGRKADGKYIILTCDGRTQYDSGMTYNRAANLILSYGVKEAYALDGGGSTSTILKGIKQNKNIDDMTEDREVSNFLYIAKDDIATNSINDAFNEICKLKQELNKKIVELKDIEQGFLRLKGKEGSHYPGIEAYTNNSNTRLGKIGYQDAEGQIKCFYATLDNEGTENTVFRATNDGLYNQIGQCANIMGYSRRVPNSDCNMNDKVASIYYMFDTDVNSPGNGIGHCLLVHLPYSSNLGINIRQIAIPLNQNRPVMYRACNSNGDWGRWYNIGVSKGSTSERPTARSTQGDVYYDTTLKKPIWFNGTIWADANGNNV